MIPKPLDAELTLPAASVAALTVYDMVKGVERGVEIRGVRLVSKTGFYVPSFYLPRYDDTGLRARFGDKEAAKQVDLPKHSGAKADAELPTC